MANRPTSLALRFKYCGSLMAGRTVPKYIRSPLSLPPRGSPLRHRIYGYTRRFGVPSADRKGGLCPGDEPLDVLDADQDHQGDEDREASQVDERLSLGGQAPPPHRLHQHDRDAAAVERREWKDVEHGQIDRQQAHEEQLAD